MRKKVDEKYIYENNIPLVYRSSGGGVAYHDESSLNLNFMETVECPGSECYLQQTVDFLESLGIAVYIDKRMGTHVDDRKVSGNAQCIHKNRVMYHCTLLYSASLQVLDVALCGRSDGEDLLSSSCVLWVVPSVRNMMANIGEYLLPAIPLEHFACLLPYFFFKGGGDRVYRFTPEDLATIEQLKAEKHVCRERIYSRMALAPA